MNETDTIEIQAETHELEQPIIGQITLDEILAELRLP